MEPQKVSLFRDGETEPAVVKKFPYIAPWKTFSKLTDEEKERIFNTMRGELILAGRMENK